MVRGKRKSYANRWGAVCMALGLTSGAPTAMAADLGTEVNNMFTSMGSVGNYTAPGAFKGQTMNTYYGGSLYVRVPQKRYRLFNIALPTLKAGCNGIDAWMGSFSHISGTEFKSLLQGITSALPGVAFQAALEVVSPLLGDISKYATNLNQLANTYSRTSCEAAKTGAGTFADHMGWSTDAACTWLGNNFMGMDRTEAQKKCKTDKATVIKDGETSTDPQKRAVTPFAGNYVWQGLKTISDLDDPERELIMNITGTVVFPSTTTGEAPRNYEAKLTSLAKLLKGDADGAVAGTIELELWACDDWTACMNPTLRKVEFKPFATLVEERMREILNAIDTRTALPNNSVTVGFVQRTAFPILRMMSIGSAIPGSGIAESLISTYKDQIAADYAATFLERYVAGAIKGVTQNWSLNDDQRKGAAWVVNNPRDLRKALAAEMVQVDSRAMALATVANQLDGLQRQMRSQLPSHVMDMLGYQAKGLAK